MKLLAILIISVSLVVGIIGAMTAYLAPTTLPDEAFFSSEEPSLQLNAPAGKKRDDPDTPLVARGAMLTPELLADLRDNDVERVHLERFSFSRWTGSPLFILGCLGLFGGAMLMRYSNKLALRAAMGPSAAAGAAPERAGTPEASIHAMRRGINTLRERLPTLPPNASLDLILETLGEAQRVHVPAFIAARPQLVSRLGLAGYAQLMDSFAAAERQINRAWSAAADEVLEESLDCIENAHVLLAEAEAKLK